MYIYTPYMSFRSWIYVFVYMHTYMCIYVCVCVHMHAHVCKHAHMLVIHKCIYALSSSNWILIGSSPSDCPKLGFSLPFPLLPSCHSQQFLSTVLISCQTIHSVLQSPKQSYLFILSLSDTCNQAGGPISFISTRAL